MEADLATSEHSIAIAQPQHVGIRDANATKLARILTACNSKDVTALSQLAISRSGLINDEARRQAWPVLLGYAKDLHENDGPSWTSLPAHREEGQVRLDVDRSFVYYPKGEGDRQLDQRKEELYNVIVGVLRTYPFLCYFQGYHDIAQVFLLVLGQADAQTAVSRLSLLRIRDFMLPTLSGAVAQLQLLPNILRAVDPILERHVSATQPFFALASTLTLYAHDIEDYGDIARLFDFLLATEAAMSLYLFASIIISRRDELLAVEAEEADMLHFVLSKLPKPLNLEALIANAVGLHARYPPGSLPGNAWRQVDRNSVLKTTRDIRSLTLQSNEDGQAAFKRQAARLRRDQTLQYASKQLWRHRRPAGIGLAVAIAVLSWYMRRIVSISDIWRIIKS